MEISSDNLEQYISMLSDDISLVDNLSDDVVDMLIKYLESEVARKQEIIKELETKFD